MQPAHCAGGGVLLSGVFCCLEFGGCKMTRKFDAVTVAVRLAPDVRSQWYRLAAVRGERLSDVLRAGLQIGQAVLQMQAGGSQSGEAVNHGNG